VPAKGRDTMGVVFAKPDPGDRIIALARNSERALGAEDEDDDVPDADAAGPDAAGPDGADGDAVAAGQDMTLAAEDVTDATDEAPDNP
jgi:DNA gyrase subunit A